MRQCLYLLALTSCIREVDPRADEIPVGEATAYVLADAECGDTEIDASAVTRTPYLTSVTATSAVISFATKTDGVGSVDVGGVGTLSERIVLSRAATGFLYEEYQFSARVEGLEPASIYCYVPRLDGRQVGPPAVFKTAPAPGDTRPFEALFFGDSGDDSSAQKRVNVKMAARAAELMMHTGDIAYEDGKYTEFRDKVFAIYKTVFAVKPFFPSPGNHDYHSPGAQPYLSLFPLPEQAYRFTDNERYYSFDWGNVHFVAVDTNDPMAEMDGSDDDMGAWLAADLAATTQTWKIVYFHHSPYSSGPHGQDRDVQQKLVPLFQAGGVDLVVTGHDHDYERTHPMWNNTLAQNGITYVVTGGGGAGLYPQVNPWASFTAAYAKKYHFVSLAFDGCTMTESAIDQDGNTFDTFALSKCP